MGLDILRRIRIDFDLPAQRGHEYPLRGRIVLQAIAPDGLSDRGVRQHPCPHVWAAGRAAYI